MSCEGSATVLRKSAQVLLRSAKVLLRSAKALLKAHNVPEALGGQARMHEDVWLVGKLDWMHVVDEQVGEQIIEGARMKVRMRVARVEW